jgi:hypothetical protein
MAAISVTEELASVKLQLGAVNVEIEEAKQQLKADNLSEIDKLYWRDQKNKLLDKESKLLDKEMFLMKQQQQQQPDGKHSTHSPSLVSPARLLSLFPIFHILTLLFIFPLFPCDSRTRSTDAVSVEAAGLAVERSV